MGCYKPELIGGIIETRPGSDPAVYEVYPPPSPMLPPRPVMPQTPWGKQARAERLNAAGDRSTGWSKMPFVLLRHANRLAGRTIFHRAIRLYGRWYLVRHASGELLTLQKFIEELANERPE